MVTKVKFKQQDGTWSENIPIGVEAQNVEINFDNKSINLADYVIQNNNLQTELKEENTNLFNAMPEVKGQGTNVVLQETSRNKYKVPPLPEGNSTQITTSISAGDEYDSPTPEYEQDIHNVSGNVEVLVQNKNWFDKDNTTLRANSYINYSTGAIAGTQNTNYATEDYTKIEANTIYTLANVTTGARLAFYDNTKTYISGKNNNFIGFTSPENAKYIRFSDVDLSKVMLLKGNANETTYTPHEQQILPFTLEQGQKMYKGDYLADDGIHHVRGESVFDGSNDENWSTTGSYALRVSVTNKAPTNNLLCNSFTNSISWGSSSETYRGKVNGTDTTYIKFMPLTDMTLAEWKSWIAENPIKLEYELAEETIDSYTQTQQAQYNAIKKAYSYKDTTVITLSSDDADPLTNVVAVADMSIKMSNIENKLALL